MSISDDDFSDIYGIYYIEATILEQYLPVKCLKASIGSVGLWHMSIGL